MKLVLFRLIGTGISWLLYYGVYKITAWPNYAYLILFMILPYLNIFPSCWTA